MCPWCFKGGLDVVYRLIFRLFETRFMMKKLSLLLFSFFLLTAGEANAQNASQYTERYIESHFGVTAVNSIASGFPGMSFLFGQRKFRSENTYFESQVGLALPSLVTAKVGWGRVNLETQKTTTVGIRIWPTHFYVERGIPTSRCFNEVKPRVKRRLERRGKDEADLLCGQWNFSAEVSPFGDADGLSLGSFLILGFSYRIYFSE